MSTTDSGDRTTSLPGKQRPPSPAYRVAGVLCCAAAGYLSWSSYDFWTSSMDEISRYVLGGGSAVGVFFCAYIGIRFMVSGRPF